MSSFVVYSGSENVGEVSAPDALAALDFFAKEQGYSGYDRDAFDAEEWIVLDTPEEALVYFENTALRAVKVVAPTWRLEAAGRGVNKIVDLGSGETLGEVRHNVVADGAIKWSAYDADGAILVGSHLHPEEAARAVVERKEKSCGSSPS